MSDKQKNIVDIKPEMEAMVRSLQGPLLQRDEWRAGEGYDAIAAACDEHDYRRYEQVPMELIEAAIVDVKPAMEAIERDLIRCTTTHGDLEGYAAFMRRLLEGYIPCPPAPPGMRPDHPLIKAGVYGPPDPEDTP